MKHIRLLHNPDAGTSDHFREIFETHVRELGFECSYSSTKETDEDEFLTEDADIMAVAGGDGTVRRLADQILNQKVIRKKPPIALLPCGTANNIGRTLNVGGTEKQIIDRWAKGKIQPFDVAEVKGVDGQNFFMEGIGFGVFPKLIKKMKATENKPEDPEEELDLALQTFHDIILDYKERDCALVIDGKEYSGRYLMVEILNIQSVGPNLNIAPNADINDGMLDVILISPDQREALANYVIHRHANGKEEAFFATSIKGSEIRIKWDGKLLHVDDQLVEQKKFSKVSLSVRKGILEFLV